MQQNAFLSVTREEEIVAKTAPMASLSKRSSQEVFSSGIRKLSLEHFGFLSIYFRTNVEGEYSASFPHGSC